jgi:hypothetical protein
VQVGRTYVHGSMAWTLLLGFVSMTAVFVWMVGHRYRLAALLDAEEGLAWASALAERRAEVGSYLPDGANAYGASEAAEESLGRDVQDATLPPVGAALYGSSSR